MVELTSLLLAMVSAGTSTRTVLVHAGFALPAGQVLPAAAELATVVSVPVTRVRVADHRPSR